MTLSELTQAVHDLKMAKYPHAAKIPHYFPTIPFVANSANSLTRCIEAYIRVTGGYADRINNTGIYDSKTGKWRKSGTRKGIADIMATKKVQYDEDSQRTSSKSKPNTKQQAVSTWLHGLGNNSWKTIRTSSDKSVVAIPI